MKRSSLFHQIHVITKKEQPPLIPINPEKTPVRQLNQILISIGEIQIS